MNHNLGAQISKLDMDTTKEVLASTTVEELAQAIEKYPGRILGSNATYTPMVLAQQVRQFAGLVPGKEDQKQTFLSWPNWLPRTFGIRIQAMRLIGCDIEWITLNNETYKAYVDRVLETWDWFNVDGIYP